MTDIILCSACGSEIYENESRLHNAQGDWHFECWLDDDDDDDDETDEV